MPQKRLYSRYVLSFEAIKTGDAVVLHTRISRRSSDEGSRLRVLRSAIHEAGAREVGVVILKCSGYDDPTDARSRTGGCYDNAVMERFFRSLKHEWTKHERFADLEAARRSVF